MRKALYISSAQNSNETKDDNRWHSVDDANKNLEYTTTNDIPEAQLCKYLTGIDDDTLVYFGNASNKSENAAVVVSKRLVYLSNKKFGAERTKAGMIFSYTNTSLFVDNVRIATCIGCDIPNSLREQLDPPFYDSGDNVEKYLKDDLFKLGWFQCSNSYDDKHNFSSVIVPILDNLIAFRLEKEKGSGDKKLLLKSKEQDVRVREQLLKRVLLSLPVEIANLFSFNTNACNFSALTNIDIAYVSGDCVNEIEKKIAEESETEDIYKYFDVDEKQAAVVKKDDIMSRTAKYLLEKGKITEKFLKLPCGSVSELELSVSDLMLIELCESEIALEKIKKICEAFCVASDKAQEDVRGRLTIAAHRILLSKDYFKIESDDREFLSKFFVSTKARRNYKQEDLCKSEIIEIINSSNYNNAKKSEFLLFLHNNISNLTSSEKEAVKAVLYNGEGLGEESKPAVKAFLHARNLNFAEYLRNIYPEPNERLAGLIKTYIANQYKEGKDKIQLYLNAECKCSWLLESIFNRNSLQNADDLKQWRNCYDVMKDQAPTQIDDFIEQFGKAIKVFLKNVEFYKKSLEEVSNEIGDAIDSLQFLVDVSNYEDEAYETREKEIFGMREKEKILDIMKKRQRQFMEKANNCDGQIKKARFGSQRRRYAKNKENKLQLFLKELYPLELILLLCLIATTFVLWKVSADRIGWAVLGSLLNVPAQYLQWVFYLMVNISYMLVYIENWIIGSKKHVRSEIIAQRAVCAVAIVCFLPFLCILILIRFIG